MDGVPSSRGTSRDSWWRVISRRWWSCAAKLDEDFSHDTVRAGRTGWVSGASECGQAQLARDGAALSRFNAGRRDLSQPEGGAILRREIASGRGAARSARARLFLFLGL